MSERSIQVVLFSFSGILLIAGIYLGANGNGWASITPLAIAALLSLIAAVGPSTVKGLTAEWGKEGGKLKFTRHIATEEEREIITYIGRKENSPEIELKLERIAEDAKRRKDEERAPEDYMILAGIAYKEKMYDECLQLAYSGLNLQPKEPRTRAGLFNVVGLVYSDHPSYSLAEESYQKAIQAGDKNYIPHNNLGILYYDQKQYVKAEVEFQKALELDPENASVHNNLGELYMKMDRLPEAEDFLNRALELDSSNPLIFTSLGELNMKLVKLKEAETAFKRALKLDSGLVDVQKHLEDLKKMQDEDSPAQPTLDLVKEKPKDSPN